MAAKKNMKRSCIASVFQDADRTDMLLMAFGFIGAVADWLNVPVFFFIGGRFMNNIGNAPSLDPDTLWGNINKNALALVYLAAGVWFAAFLERYCWTRTGERQAAKMRTKYLKALLRQDVAYFDLHITSSSEVVTSVSNDSLLIQDVLGEKVPNLLVNCAMFTGIYIVAFLLLWRLAILGVLFVPLLVIPGIIYGRKLIGLARKTKQEYNKVGVIAEQAISSIRAVYAFVGESKTLSHFSAAQQGSVDLGLRQGLVKGLAIGSNGIVFAIWSFMVYYGSRLVMYHGAQGGSVYMFGTAMVLGGL